MGFTVKPDTLASVINDLKRRIGTLETAPGQPWWCSVYLAGTFTVASAAGPSLVFDTRLEDPVGMYNTGTGAFTVPPAAGGRWEILAAATWPASGAGICLININQPAGTEIRRGNQLPLNSSPSVSPTTIVNSIVRLNPADTFVIGVFQNSAASVTLVPGKAFVYCQVQWLGP